MAKKTKNYTSYRVLEDGAKTSRPEPPKKEINQIKENQDDNKKGSEVK